MQGSETLVLEIFKQDNSLKMSIFEQKELSSTLRHYSQCTVSFPEIEKLCHEVIFILNKASSKGELEPHLVNSLKKTAQLLWDHLLSRQVKEKLKSAEVSGLILSIDEELISIPWELLYDGKDFLCLKFNLGRLIRTKEQISQPQYRSFASTHKMLILANPTADLRSAYLEGINIRNQFDRNRSKIIIDFKSTDIDTFYVKKSLCDYDIVHFAGHCEFDADNYKKSGWVLSDGKFTTQDILNMAQTVSLPALVFSNACQSAKNTKDLIETDTQEKNYSLASAFLFSGVRHYVGTIRKIEDSASLAFAKEFYARLISGKSVGECLRLARLKIIKECGLSCTSWASYLLYGDPNFALFRTKTSAVSPRFKRAVAAYQKALKISLLCISIISLCIYLYFWLPSLNPGTYVLYLKSQRLFANGQNQQAISLSNEIIKKDPSFLSSYPLLGQAYQRLGDTENALKIYFDYCRYSEKRRDYKNLASAYIGLAWVYHLRADYPKAYDFYNKAITLAREKKDTLNEARALRKLAVWHIDKSDYAKALELLTKSSEINRQRQNVYEYRYNLACDYFDIGLVFANKNDFAGAKEFYTKGRLLFEKMKLKSELSDCYFNLGEIHLFEKEYEKTLDYYQRGLKLDLAQNNKANLAGDYNMLGELYLGMDNLSAAEKSFLEAEAIAKQIDLQPDLANSYWNLGLLYKKSRDKEKARGYLLKALEIFETIDSFSYQKVKKDLTDLGAG